MVVNTPGMGEHGSTWQARGYSGSGPVESLLGSLQGRPAIVCGNAEGVFDEFKAVHRALEEQEPVIFACNDVGMYLPRLDHWCTLHGMNMAAWKNVRWLHNKAAEDTRYHSIDTYPCIEHVWTDLNPVFALSGYFAMQLAWIMGASQIVLCGCPGDTARRFFAMDARVETVSDQSVQRQVRHEMTRLPEFKAAVRSCSGWTAEFFGMPEVIGKEVQDGRFYICQR